jgi:predicted RNA-binding protein with PIN domain
MPHLVVDAMNVIGSRPTGWWRDRDGALRGFVVRMRALAGETRDAYTVIADGRPLPDLPEGAHGGVDVLYASRRGRDAADDRIVAFVNDHPDPSTLRVVTSDRRLIGRVRARGAEVISPQWLLDRLDRATG